jgi:hypothetical protein
MVMISHCVKVGAVAVLAAGAVASCAPFSSSPQPVQASNPSVTYNYRTALRTANITTNPDGSKAVHFECVRTTLPASAPTPPSQNYSYRTDQELIQASQTADAYCLRYGSRPIMSGIVTNPDGTKTVTFQCGPR